MPPDSAAAGADRRMLARIVWRALRWRQTSTLALFTVAVIAVAVSATGPLYLRAADDSSLTSALRQAPVGSSDVSLLTTGGAVALSRVKAAAGLVSGMNDGHWFSRPVVSVDAGITLGRGRPPLYSADLLSRSGICRQLRFVSGSCPTTAGTVAMSTRSVNESGFGLGQLLTVSRLSKPVRLVGIYTPPRSVDTDYWNDNNYFAFGASTPPHLPTLDPLVTDDATVLASNSAGNHPQITADVQVRPGRLRSNEEATFEGDLHAVIGSLARQYSLTGATPLFSLLGQVGHEQNVLATVVDAVLLQVVLLALLILYSLVGLGRGDRQLEIEIAQRRGFPRPSLLMVAMGEPLLTLTVALPVGLVLAWIVMAVAGSSVFVVGTPVTFTGAALAGAGAAFLGGVAAALMASWGLLGGATRSAEDHTRRRSGAAAADSFAVALAGAGLIALAARGSLGGSGASPVALLAPGLVALGAGVIGLRLMGLGIRAVIRSSRNSHHLAWFLAIREVGRRSPSPLRQLLPLTVAVVLALFAVSSWALASANRSAVAAFEVGAARVVNVDVRPGVDLEAAVRAADPTGRSAMAAVLYRSQDGNLLAVDASRLASVATWPTALSATPVTAVGRYLAPAAPPPVAFVGQALRITVTLSPGAPEIVLSVSVFNEAVQEQDTITIGPLMSGTHTYSGGFDGFCESTCRVVNFSPAAASPGPARPTKVRMTIDSVLVSAPGRAGRAIAFGAGRRGSWTASPSSVAVTTGGSTTGVSFFLPTSSLDTGGVLLSPADVPDPIPAVVTDGLAAVNAPAPPDDDQVIASLDGGSLNAAGEIEVPTLPEIGPQAALVNLAFAELSETGLVHATFQVWLSASAPASILLALHRLGVTVRSTETATGRADVLAKDPTSLAYDFVLFSAPIAALLAIGATVVGLLATGRRRRRDVRALAAVGIGVPIVWRSILIQSALVLGIAWGIGTAVGFAACRLALASLPQFPDGTGGIPISRALPAAPFVMVVLSLAAIFGAIALATPVLLLRRSSGPGAVEER